MMTLRLPCEETMDGSVISNSEAAQTRSKLFMTDFLSFERTPNTLIHDGFCEVMRPSSGVVMRPEARIDLRNDHLRVGRAKLVDFLAKQRGGIDAVGTNFDFPARIARD